MTTALLRPDEFNWTEKSIIGILLINAKRDSDGRAIDPNKFYFVGKHKTTDMIAIIPTDRDARNEFANSVWKKTGKLN